MKHLDHQECWNEFTDRYGQYPHGNHHIPWDTLVSSRTWRALTGPCQSRLTKQGMSCKVRFMGLWLFRSLFLPSSDPVTVFFSHGTGSWKDGIPVTYIKKNCERLTVDYLILWALLSLSLSCFLLLFFLNLNCRTLSVVQMIFVCKKANEKKCK